MADGTRRYAKGVERTESFETAIPVWEQAARQAPEVRKAADYVKTVLADEPEGFTLLEEKGSGVILLKFKQAPHPEIQKIMEVNGFKWAEVKAAWARPISQAGRIAARHVVEAIKADEPAKVAGR